MFSGREGCFWWDLRQCWRGEAVLEIRDVPGWERGFLGGLFEGNLSLMTSGLDACDWTFDVDLTLWNQTVLVGLFLDWTL